VAAIIDATGGIRPAFWFLAGLVGFPAPLIYFINVERGKREGAKLAKTLERLNEAPDAEDDAFDERTLDGF
jgi:UMF1 family MFS transporter